MAIPEEKVVVGVRRKRRLSEQGDATEDREESEEENAANSRFATLSRIRERRRVERSWDQRLWNV